MSDEELREYTTGKRMNMNNDTVCTRKALFLDLDGTLLDDKKQISDTDRKAIGKMLGEGHSVIIATGRPLSSAYAQAKKLGLTGEGCFLISYNGGILYDTANEKIIYKKTIPFPVVSAVFDEAGRRGVHIQTYDGEDVVALPAGNESYLQYYEKNTGMPYRFIQDLTELTEEPVKMLMINLEDAGPLEEMRRWIAAHEGDALDSFYSSATYVEIVSKGLNKGDALRQMASLIGVPMENTVAAGDAANDLPMILAAHIGCAMANGDEDVKAAADYVTRADNNHSGVAEIIERFILRSGK